MRADVIDRLDANERVRQRVRGTSMAFDRFNGVGLRYELNSDGDIPLALAHGSWGSHQQWDAVTAALPEGYRVLSYDRRGHGESERPPGQGSVLEDVADLAALIETLGLSPAYIAGNSFGSAIALRLAVERADLVRGVMLHEPPLFPLVAGDPAATIALQTVGTKMGAVIQRIESGDPGEWEQLPQAFQRVAAENAPTFLDEAKDPNALQFDLEWMTGFTKPALLTMGEKSPPQYAPVLAKLAEAWPHAEKLTFPNAGHLPHVTHPADYVEATTTFIHRHQVR
jgi:pimeloyl-ACP methyl ester carboxylesterase